MALFSTVRQPQSSHLVEFRAGKMFTRGGGETGAPIMVHPDKRKGMIYVHQSDDTLMHFCWKDRTSGVVEDDLIVFPDDVEFVPVKECTSGRVFLLKFKSTTRKLFFWMQEPKTDKDDEYCRKVNELLNHPPALGAGRSGRGAQEGMDQFAMMNQLLGLGGSGNAGGEERMDLQNALAGMDHQQLMQLLNLMGTSAGVGFGGLSDTSTSTATRASATALAPTAQGTTTSSARQDAVRVTAQAATTTAATTGATTTAPATTTSESSRPAVTPSQPIQVTDLQNILANLSGIVGGQANEPAVDLENVFTTNNIMQSVQKPENETRLLTHLPDERPIERTREELLHTIRSPQFRQAVDMFGTAFQTGQLAPLMSQFGLPPNAIEACARGDIQSVAEILERENASASVSASSTANEKEKEKKEKEDKGLEPPKKKDKHDDEGMDLD